MNGMEINVVRGIDRKEIAPYIINKGRLQMNINKYLCYIVLNGLAGKASFFSLNKFDFDFHINP